MERRYCQIAFSAAFLVVTSVIFLIVGVTGEISSLVSYHNYQYHKKTQSVFLSTQGPSSARAPTTAHVSVLFQKATFGTLTPLSLTRYLVQKLVESSSGKMRIRKS